MQVIDTYALSVSIITQRRICGSVELCLWDVKQNRVHCVSEGDSMNPIMFAPRSM